MPLFRRPEMLVRFRHLAVFLVMALILGNAGRSEAQTPYLVRDLNVGPTHAGLYPRNLGVAGGKLVFVGFTLAQGDELWATDGSIGGEGVLTEIIPGSAGIVVGASQEIAGKIFMALDDGVNGSELWVTDGTAAGTVMLADIYPGASGSTPDNFWQFGTSLIFTTGSIGALWISDGTPAGTTQLHQFTGGEIMAAYMGHAELGGNMYFGCGNGATGYELWKTDGTPVGTGLAFQLNPGSAGGIWKVMGTLGGTLILGGRDGTQSGLWSSNGTLVGTTFIAPVSEFVEDIRQAGSNIFFVLPFYFPDIELWKTDGTPGGTGLVLDINPTGSSSPRDVMVFGSQLVFTADDGVNGRELWISDGSAVGTTMLGDLSPGTLGIDTESPCVVGSSLFMALYTTTNGFEPWKTDGTPGGTMLISDIVPGTGSSLPSFPVTMGGNVYFNAAQQGNDHALWKTDGFTTGTVKIASVPTATTDGSDPWNFMAFNGKLHFYANPGERGWWVSDGTEAGTNPLFDYNVGWDDDLWYDRYAYNGYIYCSLFDGLTGYAMYRTNGTPGNPQLFKVLDPWFSSYPEDYMEMGGNMYFSAAVDGERELWRTNGTDPGTYMVRDIEAGGESDPRELTPLGSLLLFPATQSTGGGRELWKTNGTTAGTVRVMDIMPGAGSSFPMGLIPFNGRVYFTATNSTNGAELWSTDGTTGGTSMVKDINPGAAGSVFMNYTVAQDRFYFPATDGVTGVELWKSDGTALGTQLVADIVPGPTGSGVNSLFACGSGVFFSATTPGNGYELWYSDGTPGGTVMIDLNPGAGDSFYYSEMIYVPGYDVMGFAATNAANGKELWRIDPGTLIPTLVADINPGPASGNPANFTSVGARVFFSANDGIKGAELWAIAHSWLAGVNSVGVNQWSDYE